MFSGLSSVEKTWVVLLSIGRDAAIRLLKRLDEQEIAAVGGLERDIGAVPGEQIAKILTTFIADYQRGEPLLLKTADTRELMNAALPSDLSTPKNSFADGAELNAIWRRMDKVPLKRLAEYLRKEDTAVAAKMLALLPRSISNQILNSEAVPRRSKILKDMMEGSSPNPTMLAALELALSLEFHEYISDVTGDNRASKVAEFINEMPSDEISEIMNNISGEAPELAEQLAASIFAFDDLRNMPKALLTRLLEQTPQDLMVVAFQGTEEPFREAIFSVLPTRARRLVESEIERGEAFGKTDLQKARAAIAKSALAILKSSTSETTI